MKANSSTRGQNTSSGAFVSVLRQKYCSPHQSFYANNGVVSKFIYAHFFVAAVPQLPLYIHAHKNTIYILWQSQFLFCGRVAKMYCSTMTYAGVVPKRNYFCIFIAAVPQLLLYMRRSRTKTYFCRKTEIEKM